MTASLDQVRARIIEVLPRLRRFARSITRNQDDADDLVQHSVERALQCYEQWRAQAGFDGWLFGIMRSVWSDEVRVRQRRRRELSPEEDDEHARADEHRAETLCVQEAMTALPEDQRMAVALVLIEGLSYEEAATALGVPIGTLTSRLARGREALQALL